MAEDGLQHDQHKRLNFLIRRIHQTADAFFYAEAARFDITPVQFAALRAIQFRPRVDQLRLGHAIKLDRTTVAGVVMRLEKKGLIARDPAPHDRRSNLLSLTARGRGVLSRLLPAADRAQRRMLSVLKSDERQAFFDLLVRLVNQDTPTPAG